MDADIVLHKIDFLLKSNTEESFYLLNFVNEYYKKIHKKNIQIIECDFKKKEIVAFWEILKEDLGEGI